MMFKVLVILAVCANSIQAYFGKSSFLCPCGWQKIVNGCYQFHNNSTVTWKAARADCQRRGGDLAIPSSIKECEELSKVAKSKEMNIPWIGVFRQWNGQFITACGIRLVDQFSRWAPGEPNDVGDNGEKCVHMYVKGDKTSYWNDVNCGHKYGYICEVKFPRCDEPF